MSHSATLPGISLDPKAPSPTPNEKRRTCAERSPILALHLCRAIMAFLDDLVLAAVLSDAQRVAAWEAYLGGEMTASAVQAAAVLKAMYQGLLAAPEQGARALEKIVECYGQKRIDAAHVIVARVYFLEAREGGEHDLGGWPVDELYLETLAVLHGARLAEVL